jgi:HEAT repeat protein
MIDEKVYVVLLIGLLTSDRTPEERAGAARGLGYLGGEDAITALSLKLDDPHSEVRAAAAESLGQAVAQRRQPPSAVG